MMAAYNYPASAVTDQQQQMQQQFQQQQLMAQFQQQQSAAAAAQQVRSSSPEKRVNNDYPPFSRVFVVCGKTHKEEEMRQTFSTYGAIEDIWMVKDRMTKENKGICYIKFDKASSAALAIESLDGKTIGEDPKPIKAMIASSKNSPIKADYNDDSARTRLFVVCPKEFTEEDLQNKFEEFGDFDYCNIIRDKVTGESKGFGYVKFHKASTAAIAMEGCDKSLKAILAEPKSAKFARDAAAAAVKETQERLRESYPFSASPTHSSAELFSSYYFSGFNTGTNATTTSSSAGAVDPGVTNRLYVIISPSVTQDQLLKLFDIVPGMEFVDLKRHHATGESRGFAYVTYSSIHSAAYAKDKINGLEYPPGCKIIIKYAEDPPSVRYGPPSPTFEPSFHFHSAPHSPIRSPVRSVSPVRPIGSSGRQRRHSFSSEYDGRVFFICSPSPPAEHVLRDIFSRFGVLTDVWTVRGKNYGYAKFTTRVSAESAITALHGMEVFGVKLKVMLADPPPDDSARSKRQKPAIMVGSSPGAVATMPTPAAVMTLNSA